MALTPEENEIMSWGAESFKAAWLDICDVLKRMHEGEEVSRDEAMIDPYFVPFDIDARAIYHLLKNGGAKAILGDNPSMLTIITNTAGDEIIWAAVEYAEDGVYTEFYPLKSRLGEDAFKKCAELLYNNEMEEAFNIFSGYIKQLDGMEHIELGILKVANIQFFKAFKDAYEEADDGARILLMGVKMAEAVNEIMEEGWLRFHPDINLKKLLELLAPMLRTLSPVNSGMQSVLEKMPL